MGDWRKLHNEELCDFYSTPNNIRVIKSMRTRWLGYVAHGGKGEGKYIQGIDGKIW